MISQTVAIYLAMNESQLDAAWDEKTQVEGLRLDNVLYRFSGVRREGDLSPMDNDDCHPHSYRIVQ